MVLRTITINQLPSLVYLLMPGTTHLLIIFLFQYRTLLFNKFLNLKIANSNSAWSYWILLGGLGGGGGEGELSARSVLQNLGLVFHGTVLASG